MVGIQYTSYAEVMPEWCAEFLAPDRLIPAGNQADLSEFSFADAQALSVNAAASAGDDVSISLASALTYDVPKGQTFDFGGGKTLKLTKRALQGATSVTGDLAADLTGNETYDYPGVSGRTVVPEGTVVGRTDAERTAKDDYGPVDFGSDTDIFLVAFRNDYAEVDRGITLLRHRHLVYEEKIPGWSDFSEAGKTKMRELYDCRQYPS